MRYVIHCLIWGLPLIACGDGDKPAEVDGGLHEVDGSLDSRPGLGALERIAGTGVLREKGVNGWQNVFESGSALDVELSRPHFVMADSEGAFYIADKDAHAVRKVDEAGAITTAAGLNEAGDDGDVPGPAKERHLASPNGLFVVEDGTVYILDLGNEKVRRLSTDGQLTTLFHAPGQMAVGRGLWVRADGEVAYYSSGARLMRWDLESGVSVVREDFSTLGNIVVDADQNLLVSDRGRGQIWRMSPSGQWTAVVGQGGTAAAVDGDVGLDVRLPGVRAVWPDGFGGLWLGTHESSAVWQLDNAGVLHRRYGAPEVSEVRGLSVTRAGCLLVVDNDAGFVKRACPL